MTNPALPKETQTAYIEKYKLMDYMERAERLKLAVARSQGSFPGVSFRPSDASATAAPPTKSHSSRTFGTGKPMTRMGARGVSTPQRATRASGSASGGLGRGRGGSGGGGGGGGGGRVPVAAGGSASGLSSHMEELKQEMLTEKLHVKWEDIAGLKTAKESLVRAFGPPVPSPHAFPHAPPTMLDCRRKR